MLKKILLLVVAFLCTPFFLSCNIYSPFSTGTVLELASNCESKGDYTCAINYYTSLPAGDLRSKKLCTAELSRGGVTLSTFLNIMSQNSASMLGNFAQALAPWTAAKAADLASALVDCASLYASPTGGGVAALLVTIAYIADCALRVAKSDLTGGNANGDVACVTAGNGNGLITQVDVVDNCGTGNITTYGICAADATSCGTDLSSVPAAALSQFGLSAIVAAYNAIPAALRSGVAGQAAIRQALCTVVPP